MCEDNPEVTDRGMIPSNLDVSMMISLQGALLRLEFLPRFHESRVQLLLPTQNTKDAKRCRKKRTTTKEQDRERKYEALPDHKSQT